MPSMLSLGSRFRSPLLVLRDICIRSNSTVPKDEHLDLLRRSKWSTSAIGVAHSLVNVELLQSMLSLPEVAMGLEENNVNHLRRAVEIFESILPQSREHVGCMALLAEMERSQTVLDDLHQLCEGNVHSQHLIELSKAKVGWLEGDFDLAQQITLDLLDKGTTRSLVHAARTGLGISRLSSMKNLDDAFSVRNPFRQVVAHLKATHASSTSMAAAFLNVGTAEAIYARTVSKLNDVDVPLNAAMVAWRNGLTQLRNKNKNHLLRARLHSHMAWGMLEMTREVNYKARASEFAGDALKSINKANRDYGLDRILCLVATCAHKSGDPVTAQGLFASALDKAKEDTSVLGLLSQREILTRYSELCSDWEKRESEADDLLRQANSISLPPRWEEKSFIDGSLWFWFPSMG